MGKFTREVASFDEAREGLGTVLFQPSRALSHNALFNQDSALRHQTVSETNAVRKSPEQPR